MRRPRLLPHAATPDTRTFVRRAFTGLLRRTAHRGGFQLVPDEVPTVEQRRVSMLRADGITVLFDVGANEGQYAEALRQAGWSGRIVSFEPQAAPFGALRARAAEDSGWQARKLALGSTARTLQLNVSASSMSSSFLPMHANHERLVPNTQYVATEETECLSLDDVFDDYAAADDRVAVKLDVQGFEAEVLEGAARSLPKITWLEVELNLIDLYVGQPRAAAIIDRLASNGLHLVGMDAEHIEPTTGRTSWANATFRRS